MRTPLWFIEHELASAAKELEKPQEMWRWDELRRVGIALTMLRGHMGAEPPSEPELPLRHLTPEQFAAELEAAIPELDAALERIEAAKKITRRVLDLEITI